MLVRGQVCWPEENRTHLQVTQPVLTFLDPFLPEGAGAGFPEGLGELDSGMVAPAGRSSCTEEVVVHWAVFGRDETCLVPKYTAMKLIVLGRQKQGAVDAGWRDRKYGLEPRRCPYHPRTTWVFRCSILHGRGSDNYVSRCTSPTRRLGEGRWWDTRYLASEIQQASWPRRGDVRWAHAHFKGAGRSSRAGENRWDDDKLQLCRGDKSGVLQTTCLGPVRGVVAE